MKKSRFILILLLIATAAVFAAIGCSTAEYAGGHSAPSVIRNEVMPIERNRLSLAVGMEIDEVDVIKKSGCKFIDSAGNEIVADEKTLTDGTFTYEHFELDTVGLNKHIKVTYGDTANYIFYDVYKYTVNFYKSENSDELWKSVNASAELNDELWLAVWVDIPQYNYSTDEIARETDPDGAMLFNGWFDYGGNAATGLYVLKPPISGTEYVLNLHAHYLDRAEFEKYDITYNGSGDRVFNGYIGEDTEKVTVPEGVTYVDFNKVFGNGFNFEKLHLPSTAMIDAPISSAVNTTGLKEISVDDGSLYFSSYNGALYSDDYSILYFMPASCTNTQFHENVNELGSYSCAFWQANSVTIPKGLARLEHYCFAYSQLSEIKGLVNVSSIMAGVFYKSKISAIGDDVAMYTVLDNGKMILSYVHGKATDYTVLNGTVAIAGDVFKNHAELKSITFPSGLESIGSSAFSGCSAIERVEFPSSLKHMGDSVFYGCRALTSVVGLPDLTYTDAAGEVFTHSLPSYTFYNCRALSDITLPDGMLRIMPYALYGCTSLTEIELPDTVVQIGSAALYGCGFESITLPTGLRSLGSSAFSHSKLTSIDLSECKQLKSLPTACFSNTQLTEVTIPDWIKTLPTQCFYNISTLKKVDLGAVENIGETVFYNCKNLTEIEWGDCVKTIGERSFGSCTSITKIVIPDTVTTVAYRAFASCSKLTSITLGKSVKDFGEYTYLADGVTFDAGLPALFSVQNLKTISIADGNPNFKVLDGILYGNSVCGVDYGENGVLYAVPPVYGKTEYTLPDSVKVILPYAFIYQKSLQVVNTNVGLLNIGKGAFYNSTSLTTLNLSHTVENIGASILLGCKNVTTFTVSEDSKNYSTDGNLVYNGDRLVMYLGFSADVVIRDGITAIDDAVFMNSTVLKTIVIPDSVKSIGAKVFDGCSSLTSITIGSGVSHIDDMAFGALKSLATVTVSEDNMYYKAHDSILYSKDGKKLILSAAKNDMTSLDIDDGVTEIGNWAFAYNSSLTSVRLPQGVKRVGNNAFYECRNITEFYASEALEVIGDYAFSFVTVTSGTYEDRTQLCDSLKTVLLYSSLKSIGTNAFYGHYGIEHVYYKMSLAQYGELISNSGTNIKYLTYGCQLENSPSYANNGGPGIVRALYSEKTPTITYDGFSMFYFDDDGEPKMWEA